jgi:hypothetical protein
LIAAEEERVRGEGIVWGVESEGREGRGERERGMWERNV